MLEKKSKNLYFDSHFHAALCGYSETDDIFGCSCAHSQKEWEQQNKYRKSLLMSYGIHPQMINKDTVKTNLDFINKLGAEHQLSAIGEIGFDFYEDKNHLGQNMQEKIFLEQIDIAVYYKLPVVIHCRKAIQLLFKYSMELKKLPAVQFHSFMGSLSDGFSLLNRNINAYFSFGKQIFNHNKKVIDCVTKLPIERILLETDAPFQFLKNETKTEFTEISRVYKGAFELREEENDFELFQAKILKNAENCFSLL